MKELDDNKLNNEEIKLDEEALALLSFIAIGEQTIAEKSQSCEEVATFISEI